MIGKWNRSVILTYVGLAAAVAGMFLAFTADKLTYAFSALMVAGICDLFDGAVARRVKRNDEEKRFGVELDSLVDTVSFLALPVTIFIAMGLTHVWDVVLFVLYAVAGIARLAHFNSVTADAEGPVKYYTGLPVTYTALIFPVLYILSIFLEGDLIHIIFEAAILIVSVLMVLRIKIVKPRGLAYAFFGLLAIGMLVLFLGFM